MLDYDKGGELEVSEFSGHTSSIEGNKYLNLKWIRPAEEIPGYIFVKYVVSEDLLGISLMEIDVVEKAIKGGLLKGQLEKSNWSSSIHITEEQKKLQHFVLRNDKELFKKMKYLPKLKLSKNSFEVISDNASKFK